MLSFSCKKRHILLFPFFGLTVLLFAFFTLLLSTTQTTIQSPTLDGEKAHQLTLLAKKLNQSLSHNPKNAQLQINEQQLNSAFKLLKKTDQSLNFVLNIEPTGDITLNTSIELFRPPLPVYLNSRVTVTSPSEALEIKQLKIGDLLIPAIFIKPFVTTVFNYLSGSKKGEQLFNSINRITTSENTIRFTYSPIMPFESGIFLATRRFNTLYGNGHSLNSEKVVYYYEHLNKQPHWHHKKHYSLIAVLQDLFSEVKLQSVKNQSPLTVENASAICGLALFMEPSVFKHSFAVKHQTRPIKRPNITLKKQKDWAKHFILAACIKLISGNDVSNEIAELKELIDSNGKSGFSFTDIVADKAGFLLATTATKSRFSADYLLDLILSEEFNDNSLLPVMHRYAPNLTQKEFVAIYSNTQSNAYKNQINRINQEVNLLPLAYRKDL